MTTKQRKALLYIAERIAKRNLSCICGTLEEFGIYLLDIPEAKMLCPFEEDAVFMTNNYAWWGKKTMGHYMDDDECQEARLIGIAMMLTMPKSMIK